MGAVRECIRLGGCNASRSAFVGACMAGFHGSQAIPGEWVRQTVKGTAVMELATALSNAKL